MPTSAPAAYRVTVTTAETDTDAAADTDTDTNTCARTSFYCNSAAHVAHNLRFQLSYKAS